MGYFYKYVLSKGKSAVDLSVFRRHIVMEEILGDSGALSLPVKPQTSGTMIDMVTSACSLIPPISAPARFCILLM